MLRHDGIRTVRSYLGFVRDRKDAFFRMQRGLVGALGFLVRTALPSSIRISPENAGQGDKRRCKQPGMLL